MFPVSAYRWASRPSLSSGVGRQLTLRLWGRGNVYQVMTPLAFHGRRGEPDEPGSARQASLDNRHLAAGPEPVQKKKACVGGSRFAACASNVRPMLGFET